jgi:ABC-2 type transport system permease protein
MSERAKTWLRMRAIARRHAYVLWRSPHRLFDVTLWPLVDVLLFGSLAAFVGTGDATGAAKASGYLLAGIVLWHVIYQSQIAMSTGFLEETWTRNLLNIMVTPIREVEYVGGVAMFGMVKLAMGVGVMVLGALAFFSFHTWSLGVGLVPIGAVLLVVGWAISLLVIGLVLRLGTGAEALAWGVMFVLLPLSGVFYPIDALPTVLQPIALLLPTTHAFAALRSLVDGTGTDWVQLGIAAVGAVVLLLLSMWYLVAMLRTFRKRGYITRYTKRLRRARKIPGRRCPGIFRWGDLLCGE